MSDFELSITGALLAVMFCALWAWHIRRHPWMPCGKCHGAGKARHLAMQPYGNCGRCGGTGRRLRLAARVLGYDLDSGRKR